MSVELFGGPTFNVFQLFANFDSLTPHVSLAHRFVPDRQRLRVLTFLFLFIFSASHILMKQLAVALLAVVNPIYLGLYLLVDVALFILYKLVRRDFRYWADIRGLFGIFVSIIIRTGLKFVVDFTVLLQGRRECMCLPCRSN